NGALDMNSNDINNVGNLNIAAINTTGNVGVGGNLTVTGTSTLNGAATVNNILNVTGLSTLADVNAANTAITGTLSTTGNATLAGLVINGETFTDLTGTGLTSAGSALNVTLAPFSTDNLAEGVAVGKQYFTNARAIAAPLTGFTTGTNAGSITSFDTILSGLQAAQNQIDILATGVGHAAATVNAAGITNGLSEIGGQILTLATASAGTNGALTSTDWSTFNNKQSATLASGYMWIGDGAGKAAAQIMSGDATITNGGILTLKNSGAAAGTYGNAVTNIPQITVDAQGRITSISNRALTNADVGLGNVTNVAQLPASYLDTDGTLATNSDTKVASQKATKTYVDTGLAAKQNTLTAGNSVSIVGNTIDTVQDIRTTAIPTLAGLTINGNIALSGTIDGTDLSVKAPIWDAKQSALAFGNLTSSTSGVSITNGNGSVIGTGTAITIANASSTQNGLLTSVDWNTFKNKQNALTFGNVTTPNAAVTVTGGAGAVIGSGLTVDVRNATGAQSGLLTAADWNTFNNKQNALAIGSVTTSTSGVNITGGTGAVIGGGLTINLQNATTAQNGLLTAADWNTFAGKQGALVAGNSISLVGNNINTVQNIRATDAPTFAGLTLNGNLITSGTVDGVDLSAKGLIWDAAKTKLDLLTYTAEGTNGGLDADTVDGKHATDFLSSNGGSLNGALTTNVTNSGASISTGLTVSSTNTAGNGTTGMGTAVSFALENASGTTQTAGEINTTWTNLNSGTVSSAIDLKTWVNGLYRDALKIDGGVLTVPGVYNTVVASTPTPRALYVDSTGKIGYLSSSERYKNSITDMEDIDWLYALRPVNYVYNSDSTGVKQYGLIAEEVDKINKLFVSYNADGSIETVNYNSFIPVLIKASIDQKNSVDGLKDSTDKIGLEVNDITVQLADALTKLDNQQAEINSIKTSIDNLGAQVASAASMASAAASAPVAPIVTSDDPTEIQNAINSLNSDLANVKLSLTALQSALNNNSITGDKTFVGAVSFGGNVSFGADTVGKAEVLAATNKVEVKFSKAYAKEPIITVTPTDFVKGQYRVTDVTVNGFAIETSEAQDVKAGFNWTAFGSN
ncbi:MAG TPA: tail fiber domain-containing protein, partial [Patescibacteria group bacterium]|nr:tail fiber domain-containing protein [Patescibacteria group bacterium]